MVVEGEKKLIGGYKKDNTPWNSESKEWASEIERVVRSSVKGEYAASSGYQCAKQGWTGDSTNLAVWGHTKMTTRMTSTNNYIHTTAQQEKVQRFQRFSSIRQCKEECWIIISHLV